MWETCHSDQRGEFYRRSVAQFSLEVYQPLGGYTWAAAGVGYVNGGFLTAQDAMNHAEGLLRRRCEKELLLWGQVKAALDG